MFKAAFLSKMRGMELKGQGLFLSERLGLWVDQYVENMGEGCNNNDENRFL